MNDQKPRMIRLIFMLLLVLALMLGPAFYLHSNLTDKHDLSYRQLHTLGQSLKGNHEADAKAAEVLPTFKHFENEGDEFYTKAFNEICWKLQPSISFTPIETSMQYCD